MAYLKLMLARRMMELELLQAGIQRVQLSVSKHFDNVERNRIFYVRGAG
jgi:hypothetical protein